MKVGKIIAAGLGVGILALMAAMIASNQSASAPKKEELSVKTRPEAQVKTDDKIENFAADEELKKVKQLSNSVNNKPADGTSKLFLTSCAPCHGAGAKGVMAPQIAGKDKAYLLEKLRDYKAGKAENSLMKGLLKNISDADLDALASEISKMK
jgi:hypothetical protein